MAWVSLGVGPQIAGTWGIPPVPPGPRTLCAEAMEVFLMGMLPCVQVPGAPVAPWQVKHVSQAGLQSQAPQSTDFPQVCRFLTGPHRPAQIVAFDFRVQPFLRLPGFLRFL